MALNFENINQGADFLPTREELERYKKKLEVYQDELNHSKKQRSIFTDEYDELGRNITEQEKRQNEVPWVRVKYVEGRLFINEKKKSILRSMNLI
jgi:hypothetical protein